MEASTPNKLLFSTGVSGVSKEGLNFITESCHMRQEVLGHQEHGELLHCPLPVC